MKRQLRSIAYALAFVFASFVGGWCLGAFICRFSFEMPYWLDVSIRALLHLAGQQEPLDPGDIETMGLLALFLACWLAVAVVLGAGLRVLRGTLRKRHL
jgi:hypothetical protein